MIVDKNKISPYVTYGLKATLEITDGKYQIGTLASIDLRGVETWKVDETQEMVINPVFSSYIFFPMEDIIKEIEVGGKKITPIIELAKESFAGIQEFTHFSGLRSSNMGCPIYMVDCYINKTDETPYLTYCIPDDITTLPLVHGKLLQSMFFDVYGLIKTKQATDIHTLIDNPYK